MNCGPFSLANALRINGGEMMITGKNLNIVSKNEPIKLLRRCGNFRSRNEALGDEDRLPLADEASAPLPVKGWTRLSHPGPEVPSPSTVCCCEKYL
jgi:hypothetical protein